MAVDPLLLELLSSVRDPNIEILGEDGEPLPELERKRTQKEIERLIWYMINTGCQSVKIINFERYKKKKAKQQNLRE